MTITDPSTSSSARKGTTGPPIPRWVAPAVLGLCLLLGGGAIYWYLWGSVPSARTITVDPNTVPMDVRGGRRGPAPRREGVERRGDDLWAVRTTSGEVQVQKRPDRYGLYFYVSPGLAAQPQERNAIIARNRILQDEAMATELKVTPQQIEALKKIDGDVTRFRAADADVKSFRALWQSYIDANDAKKREIARTLITSAEEIIKKNVEPVKKQTQERVGQIKNVLSQEQLARFQ